MISSGTYDVLFAEGSRALQGLFQRWLSGMSVQVTSTPEEIENEIDDTVTVACLCETVIEDTAEEVRSSILDIAPYCQFVLIVSRAGSPSVEESNYDASLQRPIFKEELQTLVEKQFRYGVYGYLLYEFDRLSGKLLRIRHEESTEEPEEEMPSDRLRDQLSQIRTQLQYLHPRMDSAEIVSIAESLDFHKTDLAEPPESAPSKTSKHHPERCPECDLSWGADRRNELGTGFTRVAAHVWKCTNCNAIVHGLGNSHRHVTKR